MSRRCDSARYRKRHAQERLNRASRVARLKAFERQRRAEYNAWLEQARLEYRAMIESDPRYPLYQRLVNVLNMRLNQSPTYRLMLMARAMGVDVGELGSILHP